MILKNKILKKILFLNKCTLFFKLLKKTDIRKNYFFQINFYHYLVFFFKNYGNLLNAQYKTSNNKLALELFKNNKPVFREFFFYSKSIKFDVIMFKKNFLLYCNHNQHLYNDSVYYIDNFTTHQTNTNLNLSYHGNEVLKTSKNVTKIFSKKKNSLHPYVYVFFLKFFEYFLKKKVFMYFKKVNFLLFKLKRNKLMVFLKKKLGKNLFFIKDKSFLKGMVKILWLTFFFKDSTFFTT